MVGELRILTNNVSNKHFLMYPITVSKTFIIGSNSIMTKQLGQIMYKNCTVMDI